MSDPKRQARALMKALKAQGDPERAAFEKGYQKSSREHWGVKFPVMDKVLKPVIKTESPEDLEAIADLLWESDIWDSMVAAGRLLSAGKIPPSDALWARIDRCLDDVDGWALEDNLMKAAWTCVLDKPKRLDDLDAWTRDDHMWRRRAAIIYSLCLVKPGQDSKRALAFSERLVDDPEWFIQKAIGWQLRWLGEHDPKRTVAFLSAHWESLKAVARKEATRKLPEDWRAKVAA